MRDELRGSRCAKSLPERLGAFQSKGANIRRDESRGLRITEREYASAPSDALFGIAAHVEPARKYGYQALRPRSDCFNRPPRSFRSCAAFSDCRVVARFWLVA